jgi:hypothetical protein
MFFGDLMGLMTIGAERQLATTDCVRPFKDASVATKVGRVLRELVLYYHVVVTAVVCYATSRWLRVGSSENHAMPRQVEH